MGLRTIIFQNVTKISALWAFANRYSSTLFSYEKVQFSTYAVCVFYHQQLELIILQNRKGNYQNAQ
jgi:hypothetical protein